jgi:hypothetical protein
MKLRLGCQGPVSLNQQLLRFEFKNSVEHAIDLCVWQVTSTLTIELTSLSRQFNATVVFIAPVMAMHSMVDLNSETTA